MAKNNQTRKRRPATTIEGRENQLINIAVDLAEKQLLEGSASSQVITHFLKLGSTRAEAELEQLKNKNKLLEAQTENLESAKNVEKLYKEALSAMKQYSGNGSDEVYEDENL